MKIAVISSNGKVGSMIVDEALKRGLDVTGIARNENRSSTSKYINKDLFDLTTKDIEEYDVIVNAFGVFDPNKLDLHITSLRHLSDIVSNKNIRLIVVGGAGSLYINKEHKAQLLDTPEFPESYKPLASVMSKALTKLRKRYDVKWTYISPAANFQANGKRTGKYSLNGEEFKLNSNGDSVISYSDYAIGLVDEIINAKHVRERISLNS